MVESIVDSGPAARFRFATAWQASAVLLRSARVCQGFRDFFLATDDTDGTDY